MYKQIAAAASILLIMGLSLFKLKDTTVTTVVDNKNTIEVGSDRAILTLENGNQVALGQGKSYQTGNVRSNGEELVYNSQSGKVNTKEKLLFNYLTIPKGGQFFVQLSDGTEVWLNSDSKLKYPTKFIEGETREIELLYGEAYLKVSPSSEHNGAAFNVRTKAQEIGVLGTEFNIKAYTDDSQIETTLVEGKIVVETEGAKKVLSPNQQSRIGADLNLIEVVDVDASEAISWINGLFTFNEESLGEMMKVLSRWYDVEVVFESAEHQDFIFTGVLEKTKSFVDILELIAATSDGEIKFEIEGKTIFIK
ncbi:FecR family protein [Flagellimonas sp.]|uniref:FecR family protein n=1 Tax=Flagellimonas sp. TaxID=2058762 RepID=UPI003B5920D4